MTGDLNPQRCPYCYSGSASSLRAKGVIPTEDCTICGGSGEFRRRTHDLTTRLSRRTAALEELRSLVDADEERGHQRADAILLELLDDAEITEAFTAIHRWYS